VHPVEVEYSNQFKILKDNNEEDINNNKEKNKTKKYCQFQFKKSRIIIIEIYL
jgi:hypothetical protein